MSNKRTIGLSFVFTVVFTVSAHAATYYFSTSGSDSNNGTSSTTPFKSMTKLQSLMNNTIKGGDKILFKSGDEFTVTDNAYGINTFSATFNATAANPVTFSSYGSGAKPNFIFPSPSSTQYDSRSIFTIDDNYVVFDGVSFIDSRFPANDYVSPAYASEGIRFEASNGTIKNCEFSNIGNAIVIDGDNNLITQNKITALKSVVNTATPTTEDYGANAFTNTGSNNVYSYNYINGAWAGSQDFVWNGGAWEMYNGGHNNQIIYNTIIDAGGVAEYGKSSRSTATAYDDIIAYNLIINVGDITWINGVGYGGFAEPVRNLQFFNNTVIENSNSRFSGPNAGMGLPSSYTTNLGNGETLMFSYGGQAGCVDATCATPGTWLVLKNNIFILSTGVKVATKGTDRIVHENNIYNMSGGSSIGFTLTTTANKVEVSTSNAIVSTQTPPTKLSCIDLNMGSPAIDMGAVLGYSVDLNDKAVPQGGKPDAGCAEYGSGGSTADTTNPVVSFTAPTAGTVLAGTVTLSATATDAGGVARVDFYYGSTFIATDSAAPFSINWNTTAVTDGNYTLNAKAFDAAGNMGTTSVSVSVKNTTADTTKPTVSFTSPTNGTSISGTKQLAATASDTNGITKVEFYDGGTLLFTDTASPYAYNWNTASTINGSHTLYAKAYDPSNNMQTASIMVTVSNTTSGADTTAPVVNITSMTDKSTVFGTKMISLTASDNTGTVTKVEVYDDGALVYSGTSAPYSFEWDTTTGPDGNHFIMAKAYDAAGNIGNLTLIITVSNLQAMEMNKPDVNAATSASGVESKACHSNGASSLLLFMLPVLFLITQRRKSLKV